MDAKRLHRDCTKRMDSTMIRCIPGALSQGKLIQRRFGVWPTMPMHGALGKDLRCCMLSKGGPSEPWLRWRPPGPISRLIQMRDPFGVALRSLPIPDRSYLGLLGFVSYLHHGHERGLMDLHVLLIFYEHSRARLPREKPFTLFKLRPFAHFCPSSKTARRLSAFWHRSVEARSVHEVPLGARSEGEKCQHDKIAWGKDSETSLYSKYCRTSCCKAVTKQLYP